MKSIPTGPMLARFFLLGLLALAFPALAASAGGEGQQPSVSEKVDINTADAETLAQALKGVGVQKAAAIVAYRAEHGGFRTIDELANVRGIGLNTVDDNLDRLTLSEP